MHPDAGEPQRLFLHIDDGLADHVHEAARPIAQPVLGHGRVDLEQQRLAVGTHLDGNDLGDHGLSQTAAGKPLGERGVQPFVADLDGEDEVDDCVEVGDDPRFRHGGAGGVRQVEAQCGARGDADFDVNAFGTDHRLRDERALGLGREFNARVGLDQELRTHSGPSALDHLREIVRQGVGLRCDGVVDHCGQFTLQPASNVHAECNQLQIDRGRGIQHKAAALSEANGDVGRHLHFGAQVEEGRGHRPGQRALDSRPAADRRNLRATRVPQIPAAPTEAGARRSRDPLRQRAPDGLFDEGQRNGQRNHDPRFRVGERRELRGLDLGGRRPQPAGTQPQREGARDEQEDQQGAGSDQLPGRHRSLTSGPSTRPRSPARSSRARCRPPSA